MSLTHEWNLLVTALRDVAPVTARTLRPCASTSAVKRAEAATVPWPDELREFFGLHDGQKEVGGAGLVVPAGRLLQVVEIPQRHSDMVEVMADIVATEPDMYDGTYAEIVDNLVEAGVEAEDHLFLPGYVPIAAWDSNLMYCDTRSGEMRGSVSYRSDDGGHLGVPTWPSLEAFVRDVRLAVTDQISIGWHTAAVDNGVLDWDIVE
ncbi:SMI1/KNR4 family protein [Rhodococcus sp. IEGM 1401]|uniref:SMI1/KNR4 family protein n=1 Tax=unclassified Rhodococcus (in: high G+C Gram-positive bacteria) TaxID=192944 RepID=UPI001FB48E0D|nr:MULTISPECIES: SMI1/KNR4 family protein [unclassified Rhodococcus (in: high G+C Gram-positive bacteria)]MCJ0894802.1 SMI1/KNR4 family protein [Rhodococcus sp. ARC_M5]MCJ0980760.1 SMI1/KNR4 family protein [Rhodococcus sp. ARC_M12]MCZ4563582.1 SMI1/KNR4 family protein [Rhodococcus sp. IEGM 1401]MDI9923725.1 SMI1/KNR4 family protein [Rhodococcus sp. IEGM 1372]MDV8036197.1 SMI1/KNR4 family protein [Rhodococcus sp. IEGM 1414]